jgi:hypothetical protein
LQFGCPNADAFVWKVWSSGTLPEAMRLIGAGLLVGTSSEPFSRGYTKYIAVSSSGSSAIEINAASGSTAYLDLGANGTRGLSFESDGTSNSISAVGAKAIAFNTNSTERLSIASTGAVGLSGANYGTSGQVLTSGGSSAAPSWTTVAAGLAAATQAEMEAASSNTVAATPANTKYHPGVAKVWLKANISGGINGSYNVASITDGGTGKLDITYTTSFSSTNYALSSAIQGGSGVAQWFEQGLVSTSGCSLYTSSFADQYKDPGTAYFISAYGDQ